MKKQITIIANWKMYTSFTQTLTQLTNHFDRLVSLASNKKLTLILAPTLPAIQELAMIFKNTNLTWAAQDCSEHLAGAYTGQISAETLKSIGCGACVIGHSECRKYHGESDETIARKLQVLLDFDISPIICIGEDKEIANTNEIIALLTKQLTPLLKVLTLNRQKINERRIYLAYEPAWAIGNNKTPSHIQIETIYAWLHQFTQKAVPEITIHCLYGGSVSMQTLDFLKKFPHINGFLIGKASLDLQEFEKIVKYIMVENG